MWTHRDVCCRFSCLCVIFNNYAFTLRLLYPVSLSLFFNIIIKIKKIPNQFVRLFAWNAPCRLVLILGSVYRSKLHVIKLFGLDLIRFSLVTDCCYWHKLHLLFYLDCFLCEAGRKMSFVKLQTNSDQFKQHLNIIACFMLCLWS